MGNSRILKNAVTVFRSLGEDSEGRMQWRRIVFERVYFEDSSSRTDKSGGGHRSDPSVLYIFSERSVAKEGGGMFTAASICDQLFSNGSSRDQADFVDMYMFPGIVEVEVPPRGSLLIKKVMYRKAGSSRMWHWEVHAE